MSEWSVYGNFPSRRARLHQTVCSFIKPFNRRGDQTYTARCACSIPHMCPRRYIHRVNFYGTDNCRQCIEPQTEKNLAAAEEVMYSLEAPIPNTVDSVTRLSGVWASYRMGLRSCTVSANLKLGENADLELTPCKWDASLSVIPTGGVSGQMLGGRLVRELYELRGKGRSIDERHSLSP